MANARDKSLMRSLGECVGHVIKGIRSKPGAPRRRTIRTEVEEEDRGDVVLRRTTVEEIEFRDAHGGKAPEQT